MTPASGTYLEAAPSFFGAAFGGDEDFQRVGLIGMQFLPLALRWTLGVRALELDDEVFMYYCVTQEEGIR